MDDKELKELLQDHMMREADRIMEKVNSDPTLKDVEAPETIREKLFAQIHEYEEERAKNELSGEEKELVRLGKIYKRRRKWNKVIIIVAAVMFILGLGVTSMGGPDRVLEEFKYMMGQREQKQTMTDDERFEEQAIVNEEDAYQQIEDAFKMYPVKMHYLPDGMEFVEAIVEAESQNARLFYEKGTEKTFSCTMWFNYRTVSTGMDVEDPVMKEYEKIVKETVVTVKKYDIKGSDVTRWKAEFQYEEVQYFVTMSGFTEDEVNKTLENLYFSK